MGDKLREAIGIVGTWNKGEISQYQFLKSTELGPVYFMKGISAEKPAERARYLNEKLQIEDNGKDERVILDVAKNFGKATALKDLESIVINRFF